jgi:hypothetical protein
MAEPIYQAPDKSVITGEVIAEDKTEKYPFYYYVLGGVLLGFLASRI